MKNYTNGHITITVDSKFAKNRTAIRYMEKDSVFCMITLTNEQDQELNKVLERKQTDDERFALCYTLKDNPRVRVLFNKKTKCEPIKTVNIVKYKGEYYIHYKTVNEKARLLTVDGNKYQGTPLLDKLEFVKTRQCKKFNGHYYFLAKINGEDKVFSCTTGDYMIDKNIMNLFKEENNA